MGAPTTTGAAMQSRKLRSTIPSQVLLIITVILFLQFALLPRLLKEPGEAQLEFAQSKLDKLDAGLRKCADLHAAPVEYSLPVSATRANPRWNAARGQNKTVLLLNAQLFDGETFIGAKDIRFNNGIVVSVTNAGEVKFKLKNAEVWDLEGKYVTPGIVDMHSHHLVERWPVLPNPDGSNELNPEFKGITPFVRSLDNMKGDDLSVRLVAAGGVTTSLILPGSGNIIGGEGFVVKNVLFSGKDGEEVIEELLLEHGVDKTERRRYLKMACGENPSSLYEHTRMGDAWVFRRHMEKAQKLMRKQDDWCLAAAAAREGLDDDAITALTSAKEGGTAGLPEELELESSVAMLRGTIGVNIHCYEPEDFEDMLLHSNEFGFKIQAFHHALAAWKVPELIKQQAENITIATFSTFGLYKKEGYEANLWGGKILAEHGVPVAYKSDHSSEALNSRYLPFQAATGASFHLPQDLALAAITSVPAKSLRLSHRVGYARPGYDADLVVWDSHPLAVGATPLQVYIDGRATLNSTSVTEAFSDVLATSLAIPSARPTLDVEARSSFCRALDSGRTVINGITTSFLPSTQSNENLTVVLDDGKIICLDTAKACLSHSINATSLTLKSGHISPGGISISRTLGLLEIEFEESTGDGFVSNKVNPLLPESVVYAKYGVHLDGRVFARARIGGVTRAVTMPTNAENGFLTGVSVGIRTGGQKTILDGGIWKDEVALHVAIDQNSKQTESIATISTAITTLRRMLTENSDKGNVYTRAANGSLPLIVHTHNKNDILQLISLHNSFPAVNLILYGGAEAPLVAREIAAAKLPLLLTSTRSAPDTWEKADCLPGPPLSRSPAAVLLEAGVKLGIVVGDGAPEGDSMIHTLFQEAAWTGKFAGLSGSESVALVSKNIEEILGLEHEENFVLWEGNPLAFGSVAATFEEGRAVGCWPEAR